LKGEYDQSLCPELLCVPAMSMQKHLLGKSTVDLRRGTEAEASIFEHYKSQ